MFPESNIFTSFMLEAVIFTFLLFQVTEHVLSQNETRKLATINDFVKTQSLVTEHFGGTVFPTVQLLLTNTINQLPFFLFELIGHFRSLHFKFWVIGRV